MDLSSVQLVVADMDGTLLDSEHQVSDQFFDLYEELKMKGVSFAAASGRQYDSIVDKLKPIASHITIIAENGGFAVHNGKEVVSNPLKPNQKDLILEEVAPIKNAFPVLCGKYSAYLQPNTPYFLAKLKEYYTHFNIMEDLRSYEGEVMKVAVYHDEGSEAHIYPYVRHLEGELRVKVSGEFWVDVSHPDATKGYALDIIQKDMGIGPENTLVFGDYNNDLEMMALSHFSYAMANAHPNVLKAAKYKTASNDQRGVEIVLKKLLESKS